MKVYHGSYVKIDRIDLTQCRPSRDFGRGFYVTKFEHHARNWSTIIGRRHNTQGVVSEFEYVESAFVRSICKIKQFDDYNEEWLDFVVMKRDANNLEPAHDYDIVNEEKATDIFYSSDIFAKIADESTEKTWQEIYALLKQELK